MVNSYNLHILLSKRPLECAYRAFCESLLKFCQLLKENIWQERFAQKRPRIKGQICHIEDKEDDEENIYLRFSKEDVSRTEPDIGEGTLAGNSNFVSGHRCKYEEDDGALNRKPTGPARFWREIQIPSK